MSKPNGKTPYARPLCLLLLALTAFAPSVPAQNRGAPAAVNTLPRPVLATPPTQATISETKTTLATTTASTPFADRPILPGPANSDAVLDWCYPGSSVTSFSHPDYAFGCPGPGFNQTPNWWLEDQNGNITQLVTDRFVNPRLLAWQQHTLLGRYTSGSEPDGNFTVPWFWYANTQVVGHRAERDDMPENTLLALRYAMQKGVSVEMDLMIDEDGELFFQHDGVYDFFFTGRSPECHNRYMPEMTSAEREGCDVGAGKTRRIDGWVKMPSLAEVLLEIVDYRPQVRAGMPAFLLELKAPIGLLRNSRYDKAALGQQAAASVALAGLADRVWLTSLEDAALSAAREVSALVKTVKVDKPGVLGRAIGADAIDETVGAGHAGLMVDVTKLYDGNSSLYGRAVAGHDSWKNSVSWNDYVSFDPGITYRSTPPAGDLTSLGVYPKDVVDAFFVRSRFTPFNAPASDPVYGICGLDVQNPMRWPCLYGGPAPAQAPYRTNWGQRSLARVLMAPMPDGQMTQFKPFGRTTSLPQAPIGAELWQYAKAKNLKIGAYWADANPVGVQRNLDIEDQITVGVLALRTSNYGFITDTRNMPLRYLAHAVLFNLDFMLVDSLRETESQWQWLLNNQITHAQMTSDTW